MAQGEDAMRSSRGLALAVKIGLRSGRVSEVVWDTSGNEGMNLSRKIENKVRNMTVTLNSLLQGIYKCGS